MEGDIFLDRGPRHWCAVKNLFRFYQGLMDAPDSMSLPLRGSNLGGFIRGISPYAGHFFQ